MAIMTIGIDLAKNVFAVHGVDENGKAVRIKPKVSREQLPVLIVQLPPCLLSMEACTGAFANYQHSIKTVVGGRLRQNGCKKRL
jgi:transposase